MTLPTRHACPWLTTLWALTPGLVAAQAAAPQVLPQTLPEVVVSASRQAQQAFDAPASIQAVGQAEIEAAGPRVNLSESLVRIPGVAALNRQNYAQDLQLSIRGAGARSPFGIRGVRLIVDGIPASMPDGQGQVATVSLPSAERIEVLRGPLALLYGNAAGGVVQVFTADGPARPELRATVDTGSAGLRRLGLQAAGQTGALNYRLDLSDFHTNGLRPHSAAERQQFNARLRWQAGEQTRLTLVANTFRQPSSDDPLGLTRAQMAAQPRQTDPRAAEFQTGKSVRQNQLGLVMDHRLNAASTVSAWVYGGQRTLDNRLAIPLAAQQLPSAAGGVVRLDRDYQGLGLRASRRLPVGDGQVLATVGIDHDTMDEHRQGFLNLQGITGALKRDENGRARSTGVHAQADWSISEAWSAVAGLRAHRVRFGVDDHYIRPGNPDDSGRVGYSATHPVVGLTRHLNADTNLYVNAGRGFETPTLTEIAYTPAASGPNLALRPARSTHLEAGLKMRLGADQRLDLALFRIHTRDEIVVAASSGGRTLYTNAGRTRRQGLELAHSAQWGPEWRTHVALSTLSARFTDSFAGSGGNLVAAGRRVPGALDRLLFTELAWQPRQWPGFSAALELVHQGRMAVDDLNTDRTDPATLLHLRLGWTQRLGAWQLRQTLRIDNLSDRRYVGSVIVNDSNRRFFEPGPGRQWSLGLSAGHSF